eukprot:10436954-Alexandrium_andersonii.AAC.1
MQVASRLCQVMIGTPAPTSAMPNASPAQPSALAGGGARGQEAGGGDPAERRRSRSRDPEGRR